MNISGCTAHLLTILHAIVTPSERDSEKKKEPILLCFFQRLSSSVTISKNERTSNNFSSMEKRISYRVFQKKIPLSLTLFGRLKTCLSKNTEKKLRFSSEKSGAED